MSLDELSLLLHQIRRGLVLGHVSLYLLSAVELFALFFFVLAFALVAKVHHRDGFSQ